jgi:hypothetical protein
MVKGDDDKHKGKRPAPKSTDRANISPRQYLEEAQALAKSMGGSVVSWKKESRSSTVSKIGEGGSSSK